MPFDSICMEILKWFKIYSTVSENVLRFFVTVLMKVNWHSSLSLTETCPPPLVSSAPNPIQYQGYLLLQFDIVSKTRVAVVVAALLKPFLMHVQTVENIGKWIKWKLSERAFYSTPEKLRNIILNQSYWPLTKNIEKKVWREDLTFYNTSIHIGGLVQLKTVFGFGGCQDHFVRLFSPIIFTDKGHIMEVFAISKPFQRRRRKDVLFIPKRLKLGRSQKRHHFPPKLEQMPKAIKWSVLQYCS